MQKQLVRRPNVIIPKLGRRAKRDELGAPVPVVVEGKLEAVDVVLHAEVEHGRNRAHPGELERLPAWDLVHVAHQYQVARADAVPGVVEDDVREGAPHHPFVTPRVLFVRGETDLPAQKTKIYRMDVVLF